MEDEILEAFAELRELLEIFAQIGKRSRPFPWLERSTPLANLGEDF